MINRRHRRRRRCGYTLIEVMIALSMMAFILVGALTALRAGLIAYGTSTEDAGRQASARMVMQRTMAMIRTARLHDPFDPAQPNLELPEPETPMRTVGIRFRNREDHEIRIWWQVNAAYGDADLGDLHLADVDANQSEVVMRRVQCRRDGGGNPFVFTLASRRSEAGKLLARATFQLFAARDPQAMTALEQNTSAGASIELVGSTAPRQNID